MSLVQKLQTFTGAELKALIQESKGSDELAEALNNHSDSITRHLVKNSALVSHVIDILNHKDGLQLITNIMIETGYVPGEDFIIRIAELGSDSEHLITALIQAFDQINISLKTFIILINNDMLNSATYFFLKKKEFRNSKNALALIKLGADNENFFNEVCGMEEVVDYYYDLGERKSTPTQVADKIVEKYISKMSPSDINDYRLSKKGLQIVLDNIEEMDRKHSSMRYYGRTNDKKPRIHYHPDMESIEGLGQLTVFNVPKGSILREEYINRVPLEADEEELKELLKGPKRNHPSVLRAACNMGRGFLEQMDLELFKELTPAQIRDAALHNDEAALYLYRNLPRTYTSALKKIIPASDLIKSPHKKKSYYEEVYRALSHRDIDLMRDITSGDYTLEKFCTDTHQSSKSNRAIMLNLSSDTLKQLTKEEILILATSKVRFSYWSCGEIPQLNLTHEEYSKLREKISSSDLILHISDLNGAIKNPDLIEDSDLEYLMENNPDLLGRDPETFKVIMKRFKAKKPSYMYFDWISKYLLKKITVEELKEIFPDYIQNSNQDILVKKDYTGTWLIPDEEVRSYVVKHVHIESLENLRMIFQRSPELHKSIIQEYCKGIKNLKEFLGPESRLGITRRGMLDEFKTLLKEVTEGTDTVVEDFLNGQLDFSSLKRRMVDWEDAFRSYPDKSKVIVVDMMTIPDSYYGQMEVEEIKKIMDMGFKFRARVLRINPVTLENGSDMAVINAVKADSLEILNSGDIPDWFIKTFNKFDVPFNLGFRGFEEIVLGLLKQGIRFPNTNEILQAILTEIEGDHDNKYLDDPMFLEVLLDNGLMATDKVIRRCLECRYNWEKVDGAVVNILKSRVGDLSKYFVHADRMKEEDEEIIRASGIEILEEKDYRRRKLIINLQDMGKNFCSLDVSTSSNSEKIEIIQYIEKYIDTRFKELNLTKINVSEIDTIEPYEIMKEIYMPSEDAGAALFQLSPNLLNNKKFMAGLGAYLHSNIRLSYKIKLLTELFEILNIKGSLSTTDFIEFSNHSDINEADGLSKISTDFLIRIREESQRMSSSGILFGTGKPAFMRFLRSCAEMGNNYLRDILQMANSALNGISAIDERVATLIEQNYPAEDIEALKQFKDGVLARFNEVKSMDHAVHMHDRLVTLLAFVKADGLQPLGMDKFRKLEKDKKVVKEIGYRLFFPKIRADLQAMGDLHGWCINTHASYGDGVINNGNILVGVCPADVEQSPASVIALAHFVKRGNGDFYLEQFKWSAKIHGVQKDCTGDFDHQAILNLIKAEVYRLDEEAKSKLGPKEAA